MFSLQESSLVEVAFKGSCSICMATLMLSDSAKEEEKLRVFKMSDLRGWTAGAADLLPCLSVEGRTLIMMRGP